MKRMLISSYGTNSKAGFTLLETVVAILVVGIVIASMIMAISNQSRLTRIEVLGEAAMARCQEKMEQIRGLNYAQITTGNLEDESDILLDSRGTYDTADDVFGDRNVAIREVFVNGNPNNALKVITVTFSYQVRGGYAEETLPETYSQSLVTMISSID
jgi:type II secretory pathway pseudopilin PulG